MLMFSMRHWCTNVQGLCQFWMQTQQAQMQQYLPLAMLGRSVQVQIQLCKGHFATAPYVKRV